MDFVLKVLLSFIVGGVYVSGVIWASERLGSKIGGAVAGLPSTILVGLAFITITEGASKARVAVAVVPLLFTATLLYASVFLHAASKLKLGSLGASLLATLAWLAIVFVVRLFADLEFALIVLIAVIGLMLFRFLFRNFPVTVPKNLPLPQHIYLLRFLVGGTLIAGAVLAARWFGPVWGGIISSFPALLGSVLYFLNKSQGSHFLKGFLHRLPFSYFSSMTFLIIVHQTLTNWPPIICFVIAMAGAIFYTFLLLISNRQVEKL